MLGIEDKRLFAAKITTAIIDAVMTYPDPIERRALFGEFVFRLERAFAKADLDCLLYAERATKEKVATPRKFTVIEGGR